MRNIDEPFEHDDAADEMILRPAAVERRLLPSVEQQAGVGLDEPEAFGKGLGTSAQMEAFGRGDYSEGKNGQTKNRKQSEKKKKETGEDGGSEESDEEQAEGKGEGEQDEEGSEEEGKKEPKKPPPYKRPAVVIAFLVVLVIAIVAAVIWWLYARQFETTDDAYIDGNVTQISPQVSAPVKVRYIDDNVYVKKGDLMVELDPTNFEVALQQANANAEAARGKLAQAEAQVGATQAMVSQNQSEIDAADVQLGNTTRDLARYEGLDPRAVSQQQLDNARTTQKNAQAQLDENKAKKASAEANVSTSEAAVKAAQGDLDKAIADAQQAQVNLGYCKIYAPSDGRVTSRAIDAGTYVTPGQAMFSLVSPDIWITANYKETQLTLMRLGQPVTIKVDAFPDKKWSGRVESIQAGSGSRFSVLPAENATGNFVKIVQRVPVKIVFDPGANTDDSHMLSPGMSVEPKVKVR